MRRIIGVLLVSLFCQGTINASDDLTRSDLEKLEQINALGLKLLPAEFSRLKEKAKEFNESIIKNNIFTLIDHYVCQSPRNRSYIGLRNEKTREMIDFLQTSPIEIWEEPPYDQKIIPFLTIGIYFNWIGLLEDAPQPFYRWAFVVNFFLSEIRNK